MATHDHKRGKENMKEKDELSKCVLLGDKKDQNRAQDLEDKRL